MKSTKQIINDVVSKINQNRKNPNEDFVSDNAAELNAFDLIPIQFTGTIEDYLFRQSREIFDILKEQTDQDIEGLTYREIKNDSFKDAYFQKVVRNIPKYYSLKSTQRQKHFETEGQNYFKKLDLHDKDSSTDMLIATPQKKDPKIRQATPMKPNLLSKKQAKNKKKEEKKCSKKNDDQNQISLEAIQEICLQIVCQTPKKRQHKKVKFFQFQYVKDFSQFKRPNKLSNIEQFIEPLKQLEPAGKQEHTK